MAYREFNLSTSAYPAFLRCKAVLFLNMLILQAPAQSVTNRVCLLAGPCENENSLMSSLH